MAITRRNALKLAAIAAGGMAAPRFALSQPAELHGLSTFGDLQLPPDFKHFPYVNPNAPKGGVCASRSRTPAATRTSRRSTRCTSMRFAVTAPPEWTPRLIR